MKDICKGGETLSKLNLIMRFLLEMVGLVSLFLYGMSRGDGWLKWFLALGFTFIAVIIWGVFNVPGDPSRSGNAPIAVPGIIRLFIEAIFFSAAIYSLFSLNYWIWGISLLVLVLVHYAAAYPRIIWLLKSQ